ncbi:MAG: hypothetical protein IKR25_02735 [Muribaculaceae bacterium]|nr:hypothetical protein [Muribaculaceae bacterium]
MKKIVFYCSEPKVLDISGELNSVFTRNRLNAIVAKTVMPFVYQNEVCVERLTDEGPLQMPLHAWLMVTSKMSVLDKSKLLDLVALILCDERNIQLWFSLQSSGMQQLWRLMFSQLYVSQEKADDLSGSDSQALRRSSYSFSSYRMLEKMKIIYPWFHCEAIEGRYYGETTKFYFTLPREMFPYFIQALVKEKPSMFLPFSPAHVFNAEAESVRNVPVIVAMFNQGIFTTGKSKLVMQNTIKGMAKMGLTPFPVASEDPKAPAFMRETLLACAAAVASIYHRKEVAAVSSPAELIKLMVVWLAKHMDVLFHMLTPHLRGVGYSYSLQSRMEWLLWTVLQLLRHYPDEWITVEGMSTLAMRELGNSIFALQGCDLPRWWGDYDNTMVPNALITPENLVHLVGLPMLRAMVCLLASIGVVELTNEGCSATEAVSPFDVFTAFHITTLGRYALGLDDTYEAATEEQSPDFEVAESHLLVRVLRNETPYMYILRTMATDVGNNRWVFSAKSILAHCHTKADIQRQIDLFKQYICPEPSDVWVAFFDSVLQRVQPLTKGSVSRYQLYGVDPNNHPLIQLLDTDPVLRQLIIRAEGYRLLVHANDFERFSARLKDLGYLL